MTATILGQTGNIFASSFEDSSKASNKYGVMQSHTYAITMTSLELVDYINNDRKEKAIASSAGFPSKGFAKLEHADFLKKVPEVLGERAGNFSVTFDVPGPNGATRKSPGYRFPKREACLMAMSYSYELQAKVFDTMTALESATPAFAIPQSLSEALRLAADLSDQRDKMQTQLAIAAPKLQAFDRIATSEGSMCFTDAAKTLQITPKRFTQLLQEHQWAYRRPMGTGWLAYQNRIQQGLMEHKVATGEKSDGSEWSNTQARITSKGLAKLAGMFSL